MSDKTPAQCMFTAYDALMGAAERFEATGDRDRALRARDLAHQVAAEDPTLHERMWRVLPGADESAMRVRELADAAEVDYDTLAYPVLEAMHRRHRAWQTGGWWRRGGSGRR